MSDFWGGVGDALSGVGSWLGNNSNWLMPLAQGAVSLYGANQQANAARQVAQAQQAGLQQAGQFQQQGTADAIAAQERMANNALAAQTSMGANQLALVRDIYNTNRADQAPYRQAGYNALGQFAANANVPFGQDPGYQFRVQEGQRALQNSAAARGAFGSGATARALVDYGQQAGSQEYGNYMNRLAALAGMGQTATNQTGAAGQAYGAQAGGAMAGQANALSGIYSSLGSGQAGLLSGQGNALASLASAGGMAQAAGIQGANNAWNQGVNNLLSYAYGR